MRILTKCVDVKWNQLKLGIALCCVYMRCVYVHVHLFASLCESVGVFSLRLSVCVCYVFVCMHVMHLSILMCMCVQACDDNLWMFLFTHLPHPHPSIFGDFFRTERERIHQSCMNGD